jgi:hypothetical protein
MTLRVPLSLEPMEAEPVNELPSGPEWQYEPKTKHVPGNFKAASAISGK